MWFWWQQRQLRSFNADARRRAVEKLCVSNQPRAVGLLVERLEDGDASVRLAAAQALVRAGWQADSATRGWFLVALQHWDDAATLGVPAVLPLFQATQDDLLRSEAESSLLRIGRVAVAPLVERLSSAVKALETVLLLGPFGQGQEELRQTIEEMLRGARKRQFAVGLTPERKAIEELLRGEIAHCVGIIVRFGEPAVEPLVKAVDDVDRSISFLSNLSKFDRATPDPLIAAMHGLQTALEFAPEYHKWALKERRAAIRGAFVAALEEALDSSDEVVRRTSACMLEKIKKAAAENDPPLWP